MCEPGNEAPLANPHPVPRHPHTHTGPFFSKPCRWAAQEARAARMYRKTLIWVRQRGVRRPEGTDSFWPSPWDLVALALPKGDSENALGLLTPTHLLALTETANATGPAKLQMSVS